MEAEGAGCSPPLSLSLHQATIPHALPPIFADS